MKVVRPIYIKSCLYILLIVGFILTFSALFLRDSSSTKQRNGKYSILTEPLRDSLDSRSSPNFNGVRNGNNNMPHVVEMQGVRNPNKDNNEGESKVLPLKSTPTNDTRNVVVQLDARVLSMIEDIRRRDVTRGQSIIAHEIANYTCPDKLRSINGVEDLLCMPAPTFVKEYKNPCWYSQEKKFQCLPYFQVIGMDKCGSTDLFDRIAKHPHVLKNKGSLQKETMWWSWKRYGHWLHYRIKVEPFSTYVQYFSDAAKQIHSKSPQLVTGDGTPMDMWDMSGWVDIPQNLGSKQPNYITPHLIKHINPNVKLVVILRDPVERVFSDYFFLKLGKLTAEAFHDEIIKSLKALHTCTLTSSLRTCLYNRNIHIKSKARLHLGFYSVFLRDWLSVFPRDQILVLRTEDYSNDVSNHMTQIFKFLQLGEVSPSIMDTISTAKRQHVTKRKAKAMLPKTRVIIDALYQTFNQDLSEILQDKRFLWKDTVKV